MITKKNTADAANKIQLTPEQREFLANKSKNKAKQPAKRGAGK